MWSIGSTEAQLVSDGSAANPREMVFANVPAEQLDGVLEPGDVVTPYQTLLIRSDAGTVIVDSGIGEYAGMFGADAGRLLESLSGLGVSPSDVDLVVITHGHPDHIGGLTVEQGGQRKPVFADARHVIWQAEWEFWTSQDSLAQLPEPMAVVARAELPPLREAGVLDPISEETELLPGVRLLPAPGHTRGHLAVEVAGDGKSLLYLADAVVHELNFEHPDWLAAIDMLPEQTVATRRQLLDRAVARGSVVAAFHLGRSGCVERVDDRYRFV